MALSPEEGRTTAMVIGTENLVEFRRAVFEIWEWTDKQTDTLIAILHTRTEVTIK